MKIATWNVNSIKARLPMVVDVLKQLDCEVVCLQEIKCETPNFPYMEIEELGYHCEVLGGWCTEKDMPCLCTSR